MTICSAGQKWFGSFGRRPYEECHNITNCMKFISFGPVVQEEMLFKIFLIKKSDGHLGWHSGTL